MPTYYGNKEDNTTYKIGTVYKGNIKIGQIYKGSTLVYQSAFNITYVVDTNKSYVEKVVPNKTILSPKTFTPTKSGWVFVGWRKDKTASSSVLTSAVATGHTTLYAVFKQTVTCTFKSNGTQTASGIRYYNNETLVNATITVPFGIGISGWNWRGWSGAEITTANAAVSYANGSKITGLTTGYTYYGLYYRNCSEITSWSCGWCGTKVQGSAEPTSCPNRSCASDEPANGQKWYPYTSIQWTEWYSGSGASVSTS